MPCKKSWADFLHFLPRGGAFPSFPQTRATHSFFFISFLFSFSIFRHWELLHYTSACFHAPSCLRFQPRLFLRTLLPSCILSNSLTLFSSIFLIPHSSNTATFPHAFIACFGGVFTAGVLSSQQSNKSPIVHTSFSLRFDTRESTTAERLGVLDP